jgi:Rieske Fe-S protein
MSETRPPEGPRQENFGRRNFLSMATFAISALIAAGFGIPALIYLLAPAVKRQTEEVWIALGSTNKVELGVPTLFKATVRRKTGWIVNEEQLSVYVLTENGRDFTAMSNICTHLGCRVRWIAEQAQFFCPCHNGVFDKTGAVLAGPPPRPLDTYPVRVEDGQIQILGG